MFHSRAWLLGLAFFLSACASDRYIGSRGHSLFLGGDFQKAAEAFGNEAKKSGSNQVLFMLDQGMSLFAARQYEEAIQVFLKAEDLTEIKDYTSISEEVGVLTTSGNIRGYKGEDFEKVLINVYLALAFASINKMESARVEARKINLLLQRMITDGKRNYEESPFARYLSALLWEADKDFNSAYVDYKLAHQLDPTFPGIGADLMGMAQKLGFQDEYKKWAQIYSQETPRRFTKEQGEIVVFFEKGLSPIKVPRDSQDSSLPRFVPRYSRVRGARVVVDGVSLAPMVTALDIENTSTRYLEDRIGKMVAAKLAGTAVKGVIAAGVGRLAKDENAGWLTFFALAATDRADLRSWRTLPAYLQMLRIPVNAGEHSVVLESVDASNYTINRIDFGKVNVKAGSKVFLVGR